MGGGGRPSQSALRLTAPPKGELLDTFWKGSCLPLWGRWHGEAVTERAVPHNIQRRNKLMPTNHTPNYQLSQWERTDRVLMEDFNADNAKIDAALGAHGLELAKLSPLLALAAKHGNCQIETSTYIGGGLETEGKTITFKKKPQFFIIFGPVYTGIMFSFGANDAASYIGDLPGSGYDNMYYRPVPITWNKNAAVINTYDISRMVDKKDETYRVVAFYAMDKK